MNREIKFRGKRLDNGKWVFGDLLTKHPHHKGLTIVENGVLHHEVNPETVGQYTGLKDTNDVEIYEGDVVKGHRYSNGVKNEIVGRVMFGYIGWNVAGVGHYVWDAATLTSAYEVIGNIHDNLDFLKVLRDEGGRNA